MPLTCTAPNKHVRILSRCVHCLNRISDEFVYITVCPDGLNLKSVNQACSVFANFGFGVSFFNYFKVYTTGNKKEDSINNYKISVKGIFHVFKSLSTVDKTVEKCTIEVDSNGVVVKLDCKMGVEKVFTLPIIDFELLDTNCKIDSLANTLSCTSRLISLAIGNFHKNDDEIIMELDKEALTFRNYINGAYNLNSSIHTQTALDKTEFMKFSIKKNTTLLFCLKEFRTILGLADIFGQDLEMSFDLPNQPILLQLKSERNYAITFIISTITDNLNSSYESPCIVDLPQSSREREFLDPVPNPKKVCRRSLNDPPFPSALISIENESQMEMVDYDPKSFHCVIDESRNSAVFPPELSTPPNSELPEDLESSVLILTQPAKRFRLEILADMEDDYYSEFLRDAVVLASESDEDY